MFCAVACFKNFDFAAQNDREAEIALPCLENELATPQCTPFSERLEQRELAIVEFRESDALCITVKLFVLIFVSHEIDLVDSSTLRGHLRFGQRRP